MVRLHPEATTLNAITAKPATPPEQVPALAVVFLAFLFGTTSFALFGDWTDRSGWSELPCLVSHEETYQRPDDRPHKQGGRGGTITSRRTVCDERATVGPVMPRDWRP